MVLLHLYHLRYSQIPLQGSRILSSVRRTQYSLKEHTTNFRTAELHFIRITWNGEPSGYTENTDNLIFWQF